MLNQRSILAFVAGTLFLMPASMTGAQDASPPPGETMACMYATPSAETPGAIPRMEMGSPTAVMDHATIDLDQMYIDMMISHHASIIAMADAALPRLSDERLRTMAQAIVAAQQPEIDELRGYRLDWYGDAEPTPINGPMMETMAETMPEMSGTMDEMTFQMDAVAQVAAICAADNADLAFIDLVIPHHRMAIEASQAVLDHPNHPELQVFAQRVIDAQQREIDELTAIREELTGDATPAP